MSDKRQSSSLLEKQNANSFDKEMETPEALLNDVILQNIFKFLSYKDLKSCRDVKNTVWLRNSKEAWWSRTKVTLTKENVEEYLNQTELHSRAKNYQLRLFWAVYYKGFWEHLGHSIKYLELWRCELGSVEDFRQIFYTKLPNLEKLVADSLEIKTETVAVEPMNWQEPQFGQQMNLKFLNITFDKDIMPFSWMELLSHFPNLKGLKSTTKVDVYKVISIIRQHDPKFLKLKHLDIQGLCESDHEESLRSVLRDPNLSFETLRVRDGVCRLEAFANVLDLRAESLKDLDMSGKDGCTSIQMPLRQPLLNLETLSLTACLFTADLLRYTPNLRKLDLNYVDARNLQKCADLDLRFKTCKELTIVSREHWKDLPNSDFEFFLNAFPNVEILEVDGLDNEKFSMICERWTKLVSFTLPYNSEVNDFGLLGFDPDLKTKQARIPNITNLKDLQTLSIFGLLCGGIGMQKPAIKIKNSDVLLKEFETLPRLKMFELMNYKLENEEQTIWSKLFGKYSRN